MPNGLFNLKQQQRGLQQGAWTGQKTPAVNYLVVAGGGSTGGYGGGGAGGLLQGATSVVPGSAITVTVGAGGAAGGGNGSNSVFGAVTANGGGSSSTAGSGNGNYNGGLGVQGTAGQGNAGGNSASYGTYYVASGGGGAGAKGISSVAIPGAGGPGLASDISGTRTTYAGGGSGGQAYLGDYIIAGGAGGGGANGNSTNSYTAQSGAANTGGGAGGTSYAPGSNAGNPAGGSGIVIISYPDTYSAATSTTGSPTVSTSGSGSIYFTGSSSVYLSTATNTSSFAYGTGDFTIECWIYTISAGTYTFYDQRASGVNDLSPTLYLNSNAITFYTNGADRITGGALTNATWNHIALVRISGSTKLYLNGTQTGSTYTDSNNYINTSGRPFIGGGSIVTGQNPLNGYISNLRVVKGVGVYTNAFTVPTAPLQATQAAGTNIAAVTGAQSSLLLNAVSGGHLADSSTLADTFTVSTAPAWNSASPFSTGLGYKNRVYTWTSSGSITF